MSAQDLSRALQRLAAGESLSAAEAEHAVGTILDGSEHEAATGAFLTALYLKGETADELQGAVEAIRQRMIRFRASTGAGDEPGDCLDTCGTGGDGADTVNVSTAAAIVLAACGLKIVKHGNRAASGRSGSSDVLERLGVAVQTADSVLERCFAELGLVFLFAPRFHPGLKPLAPIRRQLPFRTIFNLVGPLCNPASPPFQLVGVPRDSLAELVAQVLARSSCVRRALVVTGGDGLDEVTLDGPTRVRVVEHGTVTRETWTPANFGLSTVRASDLKVDGPEESAACLRRLLAGEPGPVREVVLANAAAALWTVSPQPLPQAVERAAHAIDSGASGRLLERWTELTRGPR